MRFRLKIWLKAMRVPFSTATVIPVALGSIAAWYDRANFNWARFWLALLGALFIHLGTNLANDYFDHLSGCDAQNTSPTPFSGGSRVIQQGLIAPRSILYVSLLLFISGGAIGLYLNYVCGGNVILVIAAIGVFLGFFYSAKPFRIGYGSLGELAVGLGFGPLIGTQNSSVFKPRMNAFRLPRRAQEKSILLGAYLASRGYLGNSGL